MAIIAAQQRLSKPEPMADSEQFVEPGRWVDGDGRIVYAWPPEGRFVDLWQRIDAITTDDEKSELISLLHRWQDENSTLVAYTDDNGEWVDVEPDYSEVRRWMERRLW